MRTDMEIDERDPLSTDLPISNQSVVRSDKTRFRLDSDSDLARERSSIWSHYVQVLNFFIILLVTLFIHLNRLIDIYYYYHFLYMLIIIINCR